MANQRLTRVKAPRLFTLGNAPDEEICTARGLYTIIGGQVLYELADTRN